jgi:uncharacterized protein
LDPLPLFFALGLAAGALKVDLRFPKDLHDGLSLYLLLALGLKGGQGLAQSPGQWAQPAAAALSLAVLLPLLAFVWLRAWRFNRPDSAALSAHYGSVSVATFAVAQAHLLSVGLPFEASLAFCLVLMEGPALGIGVWLAKGERVKEAGRLLLHEVLLSKPIVLLLSGLAIGALSPADKVAGLSPFFDGLFKGLLSLFLLEMGVSASVHLASLRAQGLRLAAFGVLFPLLASVLGLLMAAAAGLSPGGAALLAALAASASYIAAPAAMRNTVPEANPALYLTAALGVTFPFNVLVGIPLYTSLAQKWIP